MEESFEVFRRNITRLRKEKGLKQKELAAKVGIGGKHMSDIVNNRSNPSPEVQKKISEILDVDWSDLFLERSEIRSTAGESVRSSDIFLGIPFMSTPTIGEDNEPIIDINTQSHFAYSKEWLNAIGCPDDMVVYRVQDEAMAPTIPENSIILIDRSQNKPIKFKVFVVWHNGKMLIRRCIPAGSGVAFATDNNPQDIIKNKDCTVIGRVLNMSQSDL
ncbi:XRE family transcriptional regulator [Maridesulfovibrio sp.]|uniref:XRE family transcriptional regulator n=1 Tax=Maridesulfovibrio sp. TaxID=2795000 RepID=UPI002AA62E6B|nr:XRE family transcriptional regulator [Maridesulfovibrio sp.]